MSLCRTPRDLLFDFEPIGAPNYALLREARDVIAAIPAHQIDLTAIVSQTGTDVASMTIGTIGDTDSGCGTIACAAGWLALTPAFQARGLSVSFDMPSYCATLSWNGVETQFQYDYDLAMAPLFNLTHTQARALFAEDGYSDEDEEAGSDIPDKDVFLARLDALIAAETPAQ